MKQTPKGIWTGLARNLLKTFFHWKMPDHKKWSDLRKINQSWQSRSEEDPLPACLPDSPLCSLWIWDGCCSPIQVPRVGMDVGCGLTWGPMSTPALGAARSWAPDIHPMCVCLALPFISVYIYLYIFLNLRIPCTGVSGQLYKRRIGNPSWKLMAITYRKYVPI